MTTTNKVLFKYDGLNSNATVRQLDYESVLVPVRGPDGTYTTNPFLTDPIIDFLFLHIASQMRQQNNFDTLIHLVPPPNSLVFRFPGENAIRHYFEAVKDYGKEVVILPINNSQTGQADSGSHWSLLVFYGKDNCFVHYSSTRCITSINIAQRVARKLYKHVGSHCGFLTDENFEEGRHFREYDYQVEQINGHDCGLYVVHTAKLICESYMKDSSLNRFHQVKLSIDGNWVEGQMREHVLRIIRDITLDRANEQQHTLQQTPCGEGSSVGLSHLQVHCDNAGSQGAVGHDLENDGLHDPVTKEFKFRRENYFRIAAFLRRYPARDMAKYAAASTLLRPYKRYKKGAYEEMDELLRTMAWPQLGLSFIDGENSELPSRDEVDQALQKYFEVNLQGEVDEQKGRYIEPYTLVEFDGAEHQKVQLRKIVRNKVPLTTLLWVNINKQDIWDEVKISEEYKHECLEFCKRYWINLRSSAKKNYENNKGPLPCISGLQWTEMVAYWNSKKEEKYFRANHVQEVGLKMPKREILKHYNDLTYEKEQTEEKLQRQMNEEVEKREEIIKELQKCDRLRERSVELYVEELRRDTAEFKINLEKRVRQQLNQREKESKIELEKKLKQSKKEMKRKLKNEIENPAQPIRKRKTTAEQTESEKFRRQYEEKLSSKKKKYKKTVKELEQYKKEFEQYKRQCKEKRKRQRKKKMEQFERQIKEECVKEKEQLKEQSDKKLKQLQKQSDKEKEQLKEQFDKTLKQLKEQSHKKLKQVKMQCKEELQKMKKRYEEGGSGMNK